MAKKIFMQAFIIGAIFAFTPLLGPIHELGHYIFGTETVIDGWAHAQLGVMTYIGIIGGLLLELIVYTSTAAICFRAYRHGSKNIFLYVGSFAWGYINGLCLAGCISSDIIDLLPSIGVSPWHGMVTWLVFSLPVLVVGWANIRAYAKK